jgi:hypothetical protein
MHPELNLDLTIEMDHFPTIEKKNTLFSLDLKGCNGNLVTSLVIDYQPTLYLILIMILMLTLTRVLVPLHHWWREEFIP